MTLIQPEIDDVLIFFLDHPHLIPMFMTPNPEELHLPLLLITEELQYAGQCPNRQEAYT